jgi:membrane carboxypeptidase/penicillin-binding protein
VRGGYAAQLAVPLWARFMMDATREDKAASFAPPPGIVAVDIDGASGRLATDDCRRASDSHVYAEYFARGTEPIDICPLHRAHLLRALMVPSTPSPVAAVVTPTEPPRATVAQASVQTPPPAQQQEEPKKKRGFWSKVFGIGK